MSRVLLNRLTRSFGPVTAVRNLTLEVETGEMVALLGPSGCGKTTTLRMISGLLPPTSGDVLFDGRSVVSVPAEERGAVMVFQRHLLFPNIHRSRPAIRDRLAARGFHRCGGSPPPTPRDEIRGQGGAG